MSTKTVVALRAPMNYAGTMIGRGEVFQLRNMPNDEKLLEHRYVREAEKDELKSLHECGQCGSKFVMPGFVTKHAEYAHPDRPRTPEEEERLADQFDKEMLREAPLPTR